MLIKEVSNSGKTVVISSHLLNEIDLMADELVFMNSGQIIYETMDMDRIQNYLYRLRMPSNMAELYNFEDVMSEVRGQIVYRAKEELEFISPLSQKEVETLLEHYQVPVMFLETFKLTLEDLYLKLLTKDEENEAAYTK